MNNLKSFYSYSIHCNHEEAWQAQQGEMMKKRAKKAAGVEVDVGTIVQVAVDDVDRAKVDPTNATLVVVEKECARLF